MKSALSFKYPKTSRLLKRSEYLRVQGGGLRVSGRDFLILVRRCDVSRGNGHLSARLGVVASRKVGCAVVRNRAKRQVRDWFRHRRPDLPTDLDLVVILRASIASAASGGLHDALDRACRRACRKVSERAPTGMSTGMSDCVG